MKLCTFEVSTHVGRRTRLGAIKTGRVVDLNFATAWYMAQSGEPDPQRLADALVPDNLPDFLRAGLRAMHTAEELFLGAGPHPADWWKRDPVPQGPNGETLVYASPKGKHIAGAGLLEVRFAAPLPEAGCKATVRPGGEMPSTGELKIQVAAVGGTYIKPGEQRRDVAGFLLMLAGKDRAVLGAHLVTPDEIRDLGAWEIHLKVNGEERLRHTAEGLKRMLAMRNGISAGEWVACDIDMESGLKPGDTVELEAQPAGALRCRIVPLSAT